jgi:transcriptional regulator with GAF, ATPase, and Fis domain
VDKTKPGSPVTQGEPSAKDTGSTDGQDELAMRLSELARDLQRQEDPHDTLLGVVRAAVELIPGVEEGSISVVLGRREVRSEVPSGELPRAVDAVQNEVGQGPCLDAAFKQQTVRVTDMSREQRWPKFAARALEAGAASMLSFQLYVEGDNLGALNLYSSQPNAFDDESEHVGLLFASHAAIAYAAAQKHSGLQQAVATRQLIGQAQGILMERHKITGDQAFALLVRHSQQENIKLRELSERLVRSGELGRT